MSKKQLSVLLTLLVMAGFAAYLLMDWRKPAPIQITPLIRPMPVSRRPPPNRADPPSGKPGYNVSFAFSRRIAVTAVKVFTAADAATNKYPRALWSLTSASNAVPMKSLVYGDRIRGMQPPFKNALPDPLEPGGAYRLVVEAGDLKAQQDFQILP